MEQLIDTRSLPVPIGDGNQKPYDGNAATVGNGVMPAIRAKSKEHVDQIYKRAIELGATDEGEPGQRIEGFYAGYFRDLDGNKLNAFYMG